MVKKTYLYTLISINLRAFLVKKLIYISKKLIYTNFNKLWGIFGNIIVYNGLWIPKKQGDVSSVRQCDGTCNVA